MVIDAQLQPLSRNDQAQVDINQANYEKALNAQNWKEASRYLNDIANIYWEHNDYQRAIDYFEKSLELNQKIDNENGEAMIHSNLGMLYSDLRKYEPALEYFNKTLAARRSFKNKEGIVSAIKNIVTVQNNLGMYDKSIVLLQEAERLARELNDTDQLSSCFAYMSETYAKAGDVLNSKKYYDVYLSYSEIKMKKNVEKLKQQAEAEQILKQAAEIRAAIKEKELAALRGQLNAASDELNQFSAEKVQLSEALDKTQLQIKYLEIDAEYERLINEKKIERERQLRNIMLLSALSLVVVSFFIYRNYRQEKRSKKILADKNEQINKQNAELEDLNRIIAKHNERMQTELNVGREIQMSMIPSEFPAMKSVDLYALLEPAREVGGDLYDFFKLDEDHLFFGIGDVSDKGVPAALFMAVTKTLVKTHANYSVLPQKIMSQVNRELSKDNESSMFVSYFLCVLNIKSGELAYCNAGHNPPLYLSDHNKNIMLDSIHGPVLGAIENFEYGQDSRLMKKGDQIILFTDGITEAMDTRNEQYSTERLCHVFSNNGHHNSKESVDAIIQDVKLFRREADQSDDMTVLSLIYTG